MTDNRLEERTNDNGSPEVITSALGSDPKALREQASTTGKVIMSVLDRAVSIQASTISGYVNWLRKRNPEASPAEIQKMLDSHFVYLATGSGASAGAASAIPGLGLVTGAAAVGAESLVFLDAAAFYTMSSAYLRGVDIHDAEHRKAIILVVLLGSSGTAIVDTFVGDLSAESKKGLGLPSAAALSRFGAARVTEVNNILLKQALKAVNSRIRTAWLGKLMPLGIGAVLGSVANNKLAKKMLTNARQCLGPVPSKFPASLPELKDIPDDAAAASLGGAPHDSDPREKDLVDSVVGTVSSVSRTVGSVASKVTGFLPFGSKKTDTNS